jgi:hypothetical protein
VSFIVRRHKKTFKPVFGERQPMDDKVLSALIGAGVVGVGWFVTFFQQQWAKRREERMAFLRRQLEEFYTPLFALVQKKIHIQQIQDKRLEGGPEKLVDDWFPIFTYLEDNHLVPLMQQIGDLLRSRPYLALDWPTSFDKYLRHEAQSVALYLLWRKTGKPGMINTEPWPKTLEEDVRIRKEQLENELRASGALPTGPKAVIIAAMVPGSPPNQTLQPTGAAVVSGHDKVAGGGPSG